MLFYTSAITIDTITDKLFIEKEVSVSVLRLDKIHPVVSGNKLFKLHYFLEDALGSKQKCILSFGGAYSNHLSATAFACKALNLKSIGIVRGEQPAKLSPTLQQCIKDGMQLKFVSRQQYAGKENPDFIKVLQTEFGEFIMIPEGGYHPAGARGAALIMELISNKNYSHICTATGTATTLAGLAAAAKPNQTIIGIPVLKGMTDIKERMQYLTGTSETPKNIQLISDYHFGGYAKKTEVLIQFMNDCWLQYHIPLDFVYTAKMLFAVKESIGNNYFSKGSDILCLHTGGLQGNKSLPLQSLLY
jgi:1-aminocyclopropane-1-carboxylate deaminase/D-cysteine desulfhydrase-like pyridoxal-dependent ACC family enzyme